MITNCDVFLHAKQCFATALPKIMRFCIKAVLLMIMLRSEIPSGMCAELRTVAASNSRDHPTRSLSSSPSASTINCSPGSQALSEVTHQGHSIGITLLLLVRATYMYGVVLHTHPVRGESHNQRNTTGGVATMTYTVGRICGSSRQRTIEINPL